MANVNTIITLSSKGGNAGPFYGAYYSNDCINYTYVSNVFLPIVGSQQTIQVPAESKCLKLINLSPNCNENFVVSGSASTTTTTTGAPTTTTTTFAPDPCVCYEVSMSTSGEFNWLSCLNDNTYVTAVAGPGMYYQCARVIGGLGQINIISGTGTISPVGNCKTGTCPPLTTTTTSTTSTSTTTTTAAECTSYAITNTTGTSRNPAWIDCSGFIQTTNLDPSESITICALSITNGDGCLVENNGSCVTTTTTAAPTTTTTTTQAPIWYYLYNCYDGSTTTSTSYPPGTFNIGDRVQYGTGGSILYFTITSISFTDPGGIKWSVSASGATGCPATTTIAPTTTAAPQTLRVRQCGTTSPVYYAQVTYAGYVNGLAVKLFKAGTPFNGSICWEITDANSGNTPDYYDVAVNSTWSSCSDSNCTTTTTAAPTTTTTTATTATLSWNYTISGGATGNMIIKKNGTEIENRSSNSSGTWPFSVGDTIDVTIATSGCSGGNGTANSYTTGVIADASCATSSTTLNTYTYTVVSGDIGTTLNLSAYSVCDTGCV